MKRSGVTVGLAVGLLLAGSAAWAAKEKEAAKKPADPKAAEAEKEEKPVSRFSWELRGQLPPDAPPVRCQVIRTEQHWHSVRRTLGAEGFPVDFARNMLLVCAVRQDVAKRIGFTKRPEPGQDRLEAVVAVEAAPPQPAQEEGQAPPQADAPPGLRPVLRSYAPVGAELGPEAPAAAPLRFHLIETPQYAGPVRISFEVLGPHDAAVFAPVDLSAASAAQTGPPAAGAP